ncbi:MAG TPA: acetyl-CoA carboxylase biotin carboxyl carrier protein [Candidatus Binatia bacterium]|jgi:acetyl-CoA carboxylase biotin carboxyl carrier protein
MDLTQEEVLKILTIIEKSQFDYMQLQIGELKLTVSKGGFIGAAPAADLAKEQPKSQPAPKAQPATPKAEPQAAKPRAKTASGHEITAPMVGTFYAAPEPGAKSFVELGGEIDEETTVGLIEVMKVFNAVQSRVRGKIIEVLVQNGQFVEVGQSLFVVAPAK